MSELRRFGADDERLVRYLLGLLPDEETEWLDEAGIVDDDVAARLRVAESDLVDAYVSGMLTGETLARFETFYLSSPRRREKVRFAGRFLSAIDSAAVPQVAVAVPRRTRFHGPVAAAVFVLAACGALLFEEVRLRDGLDQARQASAVRGRRSEALMRELEQSRAAVAETRQALESAQTALTSRGSSTPGRSQVAPGVAAPHALALVLMPQTRAAGAPPPTVAVSTALADVDIDLRLESNDFSRYRVDLKDPGSGRTVWRTGDVPARSVHDAAFVSIAVPAALLPPQHYVLEVAGLDGSGRVEPLASYTFQVNRR
jgi:hypothetical protein